MPICGLIACSSETSSTTSTTTSSSSSSSSSGAGGQDGAGGQGGAGQGGAGGQGAACTLTKDLAGQWRGESAPKDESGAANGVWTGNEAYVNGKLGKAFQFDGASLVSAPVDYQGPMTIAFWARSALGAAMPLFSSAVSTGNMSAAPFFQFDSNGGGSWRLLGAAEKLFGPIDSTKFQHLAMAYDGDKLTVYFDGKAVGGIAPVSGAKVSPFKFGVNRGGDVPFKGAVDEVYLWKRALTDAEIAEIYGSPKADLCGKAPVCGDGTLAEGEEGCDDGNTTDSDGCSKDCLKECTAFHFTGVAVATAADPTPLSTSSVTLATWYKAEVGAPQGVLAAKRGNTTGGHFTYNLAVGTGGLTARLQTGVNAEFLDLADATILPDGAWHHAAVTYDAATGKGEVFHDGKSVATGTMGTGLAAADPAQPFTVGGITFMGNPSGLSKADIADVVVYSVPLSGADIATIIKGTYPAANQLLYYPAKEGTGATSADASGKNHMLTVPAGGWATSVAECRP